VETPNIQRLKNKTMKKAIYKIIACKNKSKFIFKSQEYFFTQNLWLGLRCTLHPLRLCLHFMVIIFASWHLYALAKLHATGIPRYLNNWIPGYLYNWILGYLDTCIARYLDTWIPGYLDTWILGNLDTRIPGYQDT